MATGCNHANLKLIIDDLQGQQLPEEEKPILRYLLTIPDDETGLSIKSFIIGRIMNEYPTINLTLPGADINNLKDCTSVNTISNCDIMLLYLMKCAYAVGCIILGLVKRNNNILTDPNYNDLEAILNQIMTNANITSEETFKTQFNSIIRLQTNIKTIINSTYYDEGTFYPTTFIDVGSGNGVNTTTLIISGTYQFPQIRDQNTLKIVNFQKLLKSMIDAYPKLNYQKKIKLQLLLYHNIYIGNFGENSLHNLPVLKEIFSDMLGYKCVTKNVKDTFGLNNLQYLKELLNEFESARGGEKARIYNIIKRIMEKSVYFETTNSPANYDTNKTIDISTEQLFTTSYADATKKNELNTFINQKLTFQGGYNNKNGNIDYHLCKCNFKQSFKKVSAKSSREAAKIVAMKVLKGNKKSATFSLKRMVGKKEKCYDYEASLDKKGKIVIKNQ